jgi:hypothetical protein
MFSIFSSLTRSLVFYENDSNWFQLAQTAFLYSGGFLFHWQKGTFIGWNSRRPKAFFIPSPLFIFKWEKPRGCVAEEEATVKSNMDELCRRRPAMTQRAKVVGTIRMLFFCSSALLLVSVFYTDALAS